MSFEVVFQKSLPWDEEKNKHGYDDQDSTGTCSQMQPYRFEAFSRRWHVVVLADACPSLGVHL